MQSTRRSTLTALTSEQRNFLKSPEPAETAAEGSSTPQPSVASPTPRAEPKHRLRSHLPASTSRPAPRPLQSITLRLTTDAVRMLRRAAALRGLDYVQPYTQQAIVEAALREWLARNGVSPADGGD